MAKEIKIYESDVPVSGEEIEHAILLIRGHKVMLDRDLAQLYGVETKALKRAVQRNADRFPADFMFQLTPEEHNSLRFQFGTLKRGHQIAHGKDSNITVARISGYLDKAEEVFGIY